MEKIRKALKRFQAVVESLECECDTYHRYTCTIHSDRILAKAALIELDTALTKAMPSDGRRMEEGYPEGWKHCMIHLNPKTGTMHSDGDHSVREWIEKRIVAP